MRRFLISAVAVLALVASAPAARASEPMEGQRDQTPASFTVRPVVRADRLLGCKWPGYEVAIHNTFGWTIVSATSFLHFCYNGSTIVNHSWSNRIYVASWAINWSWDGWVEQDYFGGDNQTSVSRSEEGEFSACFIWGCSHHFFNLWQKGTGEGKIYGSGQWL